MDVKPLKENLLNLVNPDLHNCYVFHYNKSHSQLLIDVYDTENDERTRVNFSGVVYFSGELQWKGANFVIHMPETGLNLLRKLEWYSNMTKDVLERLDVENIYKYYEITRNFAPIIIVASSIEIDFS